MDYVALLAGDMLGYPIWIATTVNIAGFETHLVISAEKCTWL